MKTFNIVIKRVTRVAGLFLLATVAHVASAAAGERWATLEAIHNLENPRNLTRPGSRGELGAYQFRSSTWRMHTSRPFQQALNRAASDEVAVKHYEWIKRGLEEARVPATTYNIALAWNSGLTAVITGRAPKVAHRYAERAVNLSLVFNREQAYAMR